ncbi:MAG: exosortase/archaeosortase family protein [Candidatus Marsarchaeota archaeon]|jgi:exosortase/archaeosortase family protein|nr:exosortase/archaeosortase family protein [Candidatus Marsarchaeota archaeon]MCL5418497.1 exosortase/archaeosortase family protein [Candidatus Marsarchaeota archaeon]
MANNGKLIGIIVLLAAFLLGAFSSILITSPSILDTDSSTYIIVVMLMLPVMIIFSAKEDLKLSNRLSSTIFGLALFAVFVLVTAFARIAFSFAFMSYRIDAFIWPVFIMALVAIIFGFDGIRKMKVLVVYSIFASPLLLLPLFALNGAWALANSNFVYALLKVLGVPLSKIGSTFSGLSGPTITISTTCVSLGTFVALAMFMIPVAYLYKGSIRRKALWLLGGIVLMVALNLARMIAVILAGAYYGLGNSVLIFHAFAGQILFYIAVIVMILLGGRFGLHIQKLSRQTMAKHRPARGATATLSIALVLGLVALVLASQYGSALMAPALLFSGNSSVTQSALIGKVIISLENANSNILQLYTSNTLLLYGLQNTTSNSTIYAMIKLNARPDGGYIITNNYSSIKGKRTALLPNGITLHEAIITSKNTTFEIDYFSMPYVLGGKYVTENYELFAPINESYRIRTCIPSSGVANGAEAAMYNALSMSNATVGFMCAAYNIAKSA